MAALIGEKGYKRVVLYPLYEAAPFDLVYLNTRTNKHYRVQVKYSSITKNNELKIDFRSKSSPDEIDIYATYIPDQQRILFIRASHAGKGKKKKLRC